MGLFQTLWPQIWLAEQQGDPGTKMDQTSLGVLAPPYVASHPEEVGLTTGLDSAGLTLPQGRPHLTTDGKGAGRRSGETQLG